MSEPWYKDGLSFECTQCGNCCTGAPGYVWVNKEEIAAMAVLVQLEVDEFEKRYVRRVGIRKSLVEYPNGACVFLDEKTRGCQLYGARPRQCRTWPFWGSNLRSPVTWARAAEHCPGCNKGPVRSLDEIKSQLKIIDI